MAAKPAVTAGASTSAPACLSFTLAPANALKPVFGPEPAPKRLMKMYVAVNADLGMTAGKVGQHVGHAVSKWFLDYLATEEKDEQRANAQMSEWISDGEEIIVLGATKKEMDALPAPDIEIFDAGPADAPAVIAWKPTAATIRGLNKLRNLV